jgi:general secretion pathway protein D
MDVGLKLDVEPIIYGGNEVVLKIALEVSTLGAKIGDYFTFGTRNANTTLRLRDGENQVLAGLIKDEDRRVASKVPGVGEMPIVGRLFGTQQDSGNKTEIVLSITPRLTRRGSFADAASREFRSGTESSMRERPLSAEAAVAVPLAKGAMPAALSAPMAALAPLSQAPALKPEPVVATPVQVPVSVLTPQPVVLAAPRPTPVELSATQAKAPTPAERELASIAISALKNYNLARPINPPDMTNPWDAKAGLNPAAAPVQGGQ